jgi:hypothetical protein
MDEIVERVLTGLDELEDEAYDQRDEEAYGACQEAYYEIANTLTDDGQSTDATPEAVVRAVDGPIAYAVARLRPDLPLPPGAEPPISASQDVAIRQNVEEESLSGFS